MNLESIIDVIEGNCINVNAIGAFALAYLANWIVGRFYLCHHDEQFTIIKFMFCHDSYQSIILTFQEGIVDCQGHQIN